jgi:ribosomal-protein-alanine N-acetyltransferase
MHHGIIRRLNSFSNILSALAIVVFPFNLVRMFPTLYTERLLLREILPTDINAVFDGLSHPEVIRYYGVSFATLEATREQMDWYSNMIKNDEGRCWAICSKDNNEFYGVITLPFWKKEHRSIELGYWLLPDYWNKGFISEALRVVIDHAFNHMNIHRIFAESEDDNPASIATLKKMGFEYEGKKRECEIKNGRFINLDMYALLNNTR